MSIRQGLLGFLLFGISAVAVSQTLDDEAVSWLQHTFRSTPSTRPAMKRALLIFWQRSSRPKALNMRPLKARPAGAISGPGWKAATNRG